MIKYHSVRSDMPDYPSTRNRSVQDSLVWMVEFELGYGGRIADVTLDGDTAAIVCHTPILDHHDIVTFRGPRDEMMLLLEAAYIYHQLAQAHMPMVIEKVIDKLQGTPAGHNTLLFTAIAPLLVGQSFVKAVYINLMGETAEAHVDVLIDKRSGDLAAIVALLREGVDITDALALAS